MTAKAEKPAEECIIECAHGSLVSSILAKPLVAGFNVVSAVAAGNLQAAAPHLFEGDSPVLKVVSGVPVAKPKKRRRKAAGPVDVTVKAG